MNSSQLIKTFLAEERALLAVGLIGFALAAWLGVLILVQGPVRAPEAVLFKGASFDFALGFFVITLGLLLPVAGFSRFGRAAWRWTAVTFILLSYAIETGQMLRGLDPRFTRAGSPADQALGGIFFLVAQVVFVLFLVMAWKFFRNADDNNALLVLSVRYGSVAAVAGFSMGYLMSAMSGPGYGSAGNMLPLHAAGFHGLQAVPLVALMLSDSRMSDADKHRQVHSAGIAWLILCLGIALQTFAGRPALDASFGTAVALAGFAAWAFFAARAVQIGLPLLRHGTA